MKYFFFLQIQSEKMFKILFLLLLNYNFIFTVDDEFLITKAGITTKKSSAGVTTDKQISNDVAFLPSEDGEINFRLPKTVKPTNYHLELVTFLDEEIDRQFYFKGIVTIIISVNIKTKRIILHSKGLKIEAVELKKWPSKGQVIAS